MGKNAGYNGAFQIARKLFDSELWNEKPASWTKIWIYIIGKVNHKDNGKYKKGEGFFNFSDEFKKIGHRDITKDIIKKFTKYALQNEMISTRRSTRGIWIKVLKYGLYQGFDNYKAPQNEFSGTSEALQKHFRSTPINNNDKNDKNDNNTYTPEFLSFFKSYPRKEDKLLAFKEWQKLKPSPELITEIMAGLEKHKQTERWQEDNGKYAVYACRFLKNRKWEDEIIIQPKREILRIKTL